MARPTHLEITAIEEGFTPDAGGQACPASHVGKPQDRAGAEGAGGRNGCGRVNRLRVGQLE